MYFSPFHDFRSKSRFGIPPLYFPLKLLRIPASSEFISREAFSLSSITRDSGVISSTAIRIGVVLRILSACTRSFAMAAVSGSSSFSIALTRASIAFTSCCALYISSRWSLLYLLSKLSNGALMKCITGLFLSDGCAIMIEYSTGGSVWSALPASRYRPVKQ